MPLFSWFNSKLSRMSGSWLIFCGALLWSTAGAVVKSFATDPLLLAGVRSLLGGVVLSVFIRPRKIRFDRWLLGAILFYTAMVACVITAFRLTNATLVIAMQYTAPIWLFVLNWCLTKKPAKERVLVLLLIVAAMLLFVLQPSSAASLRGNLLALCMGILFAGLTFCLKKIRQENPLGIVALLNLGSALILLPVAFALPGVTIYVAPGDWLYILYLAIFQLSAGYFFYMLGLQKVTPQKGALLAVWELVLTPVWAFLLVRELPSPQVAAGSLLLIAALFWDNRLDGLARAGAGGLAAALESHEQDETRRERA